MSRYEWREGYGLWDSARGTYLLLGDDEHAPILWRALMNEHVAELERLRRELASARHCREEEYRQREAWRAKAGRLEEVLGQIAKRPQPEKYTDWTAWHTWAGEVQELAAARAPEEH